LDIFAPGKKYALIPGLAGRAPKGHVGGEGCIYAHSLVNHVWISVHFSGPTYVYGMSCCLQSIRGKEAGEWAGLLLYTVMFHRVLYS
jgi:hypothetical protein